MRLFISLLGLSSLLAFCTPASAQATPPGDAYLCYKAALAPKEPKLAPAQKTIQDQLGALTADLKGFDGLCTPTQSAAHPTVHPVAYKIAPAKTPPQPKFAKSVRTVVDEAGTHALVLVKPTGMLVPSAAVPGPDGTGVVDTTGVDHFKCYKAVPAKGAAKPVPPPTPITDEFGTQTYTFKKVTKLCTPANVDGTDATAPQHAGHLICYQAKLTAGAKFDTRTVSVNNGGVGPAVLVAKSVRELCLPAVAAPASGGGDTTVTAFDDTPFYFTGSDNQRTVDAAVQFPALGTYQSIVLHIALSCPVGGCDPWDRFGSLGVVTQTTGGVDTVVEIARFITPFKVGAQWDVDVTDLRPLLSGNVALRGFIDTWVGPGSQYGAGWLLSASFEMTAGTPAALPIAVLPVWTLRSAVYGDPAVPIATSVPPATVTLPAAGSYALRTFVTGHGQGNAGNCAEFCSRDHTLSAGGTPHTTTIWRTDCATTAAPGQQGTYQYSRGGWCPGADVRPWTVDVTGDVTAGGQATFTYDVQSYENTCRPDADPCLACTLGTGCPYDGGAHTEPAFQVSTVVIAYQ